MKTAEIFLKWNSKQGAFEFKQDEHAKAIFMDIRQMNGALAAVKGTSQGDVLAFLIDTAQKTPDKWHSASSAALKPGQGVIG